MIVLPHNLQNIEKAFEQGFVPRQLSDAKEMEKVKKNNLFNQIQIGKATALKSKETI